MRLKLKNVDRFTDAHGHARYYYRLGKGPRIRLEGVAGSPEFIASYEAAARKLGSTPSLLKSATGSPGTFDRLAHDYFQSPEYLHMKPATQHAYRLLIERVIREENIGHRQVREMERSHVKRMMGKRADRKGAANDMLKKLKVLIHFAIDNGWRVDDPTLRIKKFEAGSFHSWTDAEIGTYESQWKEGTRQRLAFGLLLYTGQRRSDVVRMRWEDATVNGIAVVQSKTDAKLIVPIHSKLRRLLDMIEPPDRKGTILKTTYGKPFAVAGFGNWMHDNINDAGLPSRCVSHGLRKAAARRLAEVGCSANEIAAITGHATLAEVERYTRAASQVLMAKTAMQRLE